MNQKTVNTSIRKKDAMALVTGKPVYTDDLAPKDCLIVKILRSPYAHAIVKEVQKEKAMKVPGMECIITHEDAPNSRFTIAGQTYPELSPYDRLILEDRVRFVGDAVAILAGKNEAAVNKAMKLVKVTYEVLEPVLDFTKAKDHKVTVHPENDWKVLIPLEPDKDRNVVCHGVQEQGNVEEELAKCKYVIDETYHTQANQQAMMETFRCFTYMDAFGRLTVVSSTQVPFHVRKTLATALETKKSNIRVVKPRIGGGFGAKQTVVCEVYPALVTWITGKPAKIIYSREESQIASSPRHEMQVRVTIGSDENGRIQAMNIATLSNAGAYGDHTPTTIGLTGTKTLPLYTSNAKAYKFEFEGVYTNQMAAGAYRGYGATQGLFAVESAINELATKLHMDPAILREINMVKEGDLMTAYHGETANSCALDRCLAKAKEMIDWDKKYPSIDMGDGKVRSVGIAAAMQGSSIQDVDVASVSIKVSDDGFYNMRIGATDMGTGCDTILAQIAADCLDTDIDNIIVSGVDTDVSPYDSGSYASSTTYLTGMATVKTCETLKKKIIEAGAELLGCNPEDADFDGVEVFEIKTNKNVTLKDLANQTMCGSIHSLEACERHTSPVSPPPYMVGAVEIEIDKETGHIEILDYVAVVDCGTVINPNLARVQTEGGIVQGIGMALYEEVVYNNKGKCGSNSFMQYKIPSRLDIGPIRVAFESSYEPTGPFGAKSIGELVINTPSPALANAVYNGTGVRVRSLPITSEKIVMGRLEK
jgi:CO/xanthine dehydrogenase Mo-binding subunit